MAEENKENEIQNEVEEPQSRPQKLGLEALEGLSREYGGWQRLAEKLQKDNDKIKEENWKYREERRSLRGRVKELEETVQDALVLKGDEAKEHKALKELGNPEEVRAKLEEGRSAVSELSGLKREKTLSEAAGLLDMKSSVLARFVKADGIEVEIDEVKEGEEVKQVPVVLLKGEGDQEDQRKPLAEYAKVSWADSFDVLKGDQQKPKRPNGPDPRAPVDANGEGSLEKVMAYRFGTL